MDPVVAKNFQRMLTNFVMRGNPNVGSLPEFEMYGMNETISNLNVTDFGEHIRDTVQSSRCKFWKEAPYVPVPSE
jgi:hypothetical protein